MPYGKVIWLTGFKKTTIVRASERNSTLPERNTESFAKWLTYPINLKH